MNIAATHLFATEISFVNFLSFRSYQIGSIAQNKNLETPEIVKSLKTLNFVS